MKPMAGLNEKIILMQERDIVLCLWIHTTKSKEYVVWRKHGENDYYNGNYYGNDLVTAIKGFKQRAGVN